MIYKMNTITKSNGISLGKQCLIDASNCEPCDYNDKDVEMLTKIVNECGATIVNTTIHKFNPFGTSLVFVLSESHISIHTYPEYKKIFLDVFTCGDKVCPKQIAEKIINYSNGTIDNFMFFNRGIT